jgi:type II secretory ATPase GspE/PulE/Tfp pilus assembly ATPase PilB-like protein
LNQTAERPLLDVLEDGGFLSADQASQARARIAAQPGDADEILLEYSSAAAIAVAKEASRLNMPCVWLASRAADDEAVAAMRPSYAYKQHVAPLAIRDGSLVVAVVDALDIALLDELTVLTGMSVTPVLADVEDIEDAIRRFYGKSTEELISGQLASPTGSVALETVEEIHDYGLQADVLAQDPTVMEAVNQIIIDAVREGATDIHVEPFELELQIRFRLDGVLEKRPSPPKHLQPAITSRIKLMSHMNIAETRRPQDGRIEVIIATLGRREIDIRVSTVPTIWGESIAMRILDRNMVRLGLAQVGLLEDDYQTFLKMIAKPWGIILATGPTGSGKTTTLNACLNEMKDIGSKIVTVEDPVEYDLEGINQINVNAEIDVTFERALRHILRQDPDKVMVGEIRDMETADMAIHTSLTGHLVLSSLHTNDAPSAITRLVAMGVDPYLVASTLEGVIAQRLPRRVCKQCCTHAAPTAAELESMGVSPDEASDDWLVPHPVGCPVCRNTGFKGRTGMFEIMHINDELRAMALESIASSQLRAAAIRAGMRTLRQDGWRKALAGTTTVEEVRRLTPDAETSMVVS